MRLTIADWNQRYSGTYIICNGALRYLDSVHSDQRNQDQIDVETSKVYMLLSNGRSYDTVKYDENFISLELPKCGFYNFTHSVLILQRKMDRQFKRTLCDGNATAYDVAQGGAHRISTIVPYLNKEIIYSPQDSLRLVSSRERLGAVLSRGHALISLSGNVHLVNKMRIAIASIKDGVIKPAHANLEQEVKDIVSRNHLPLVIK